MTGPATSTASRVLWLLVAHLPRLLSQAVSILPTTPSSTFPACAFSCDNLNAASSYCLQTNQGASQQTINSCFCQRAEVTPFYTGSTGVCDTFCPADSDSSSLQTWFRDYCAAAGFSGNGGGTTTTMITSTRSATSTANGRLQTGSGTGATSSSSQGSGWFSTHWKWIVMLLVLLVGLGAIALLAVCLKRRHARKVADRQTAMSGFANTRRGSSPEMGRGQDMWGPHQHMAHTGGWEYTSEQDREMREASAAASGGVFGGAIGKAKSLRKGGGSKKLGKKSRHGSQRSARPDEIGHGRVRGEEDEHSQSAIGSIRRSKSERRREREREREMDKEIERGLRGLPVNNREEKHSKEKQRADKEDMVTPEASDNEKTFG